MGTKFTTQTISGYNASPPADDASQVSANQLSWAKHKTKLGDPVKTLAEAINDALVTHVDETVVDKAVIFTTTVAEHKRTINVTADATMTLGDAATMGAGYIVTIKNSHTAANTVGLDTGADTLDGVANGTYILESLSSAIFIVNVAADGFYVISNFLSPVKGADIASATALPYQSTAYADVTGTTTITSLLTSGKVGTVIKRHFDDVLTLTHNATDLILPGGVNITTAAGDEAEFVEYQAGDWICTNYQTPVPQFDGIQFPATQVSSSDVNAFDDYEEGTFTAALSADGGTITINTSFDTLAYTKWGRVVHVQGQIRVTSVSTPTGDVFLDNFPFAIATGSEGEDVVSVPLYAAFQNADPDGWILLRASSGTSMTIKKSTGASMVSEVVASTQFEVNVTYAAAT